MDYKYRVYEAVNNDGENLKEHGHFETLKEAQFYAASKYRNKQRSTFIVNYELDDKKIAEQYYGNWAN